MNLREQLRNILPDILPGDPEEAIKGTELIRLVRLRLGDDYSDATLKRRERIDPKRHGNSRKSATHWMAASDDP